MGENANETYRRGTAVLIGDDRSSTIFGLEVALLRRLTVNRYASAEEVHLVSL